MKKIYFPNLNALRFIAAFIVMFTHFGQLNLQLVNKGADYYATIGRLGVVLFFTLSGFLITYLLLVEKTETGTIKIRHFYKRRILRIWPLYYLIIIGSLYVFNNIQYLQIPGVTARALHENFVIKNVLYLGMLPNVAYAMGYLVPYTFQTWSIGVEEQFYLFWPFLFKRINNSLKLLITVAATYLFIKILFYLLAHYSKNGLMHVLDYFVNLLCFDSMAIGGIVALLLFNQNRIIKVLFLKEVQLVVWLVSILLISMGVDFGLFQYEIYSILFALIIINLAGNKNVLFTLDNTLLNYLGKISYGLYMYHFITMRVADLMCYKYPVMNTAFIKFSFVLIVTIAIASLSYEFFEKRFINLKLKYSTIITGDNLAPTEVLKLNPA